MLERLIGADVHLVLRADQADHTALVNAHALEQVIVNLAVNARDAMPNGGTLTIETAAVKVDEPSESSALQPGDYVVLSVCDTGTGIPTSALDQIFEPFFTTKEAQKGTGLGLAICYGIIHQAGGTISVSSEAGNGTRFEVVLPHHVAA